jgi:nucleotide-binding universal stress UspA family protein
MFQMRRVLVPTDFSTHADAALEHAIVLGLPYKAEITLMHVDEFPVSSAGGREIHDERVEAFRRYRLEFYEAQFERLRLARGNRPVCLKTEVREGRAYKVIVEESERKDYDLIVLATRGQTHLSTALIGGTSERVVRLSRQPVLSIQGPPLHGGNVKTILCPTDLSPAGNVALSYALSIARQYTATLYIQYISELEKPEPVADVRKRLPDLKEFHPDADRVSVEYFFDRDIEPSNSIIRLAEDRDVSLVVMSTHGKKGLRRVYIGNNTAEVVRQSSRPILTVTHPLHRKVFSKPTTEKSASHLA